MKHILNKTLLAIATTATLLLSGCTKDNTELGGNPISGHRVSVTLPFTITDTEPATATPFAKAIATTSKSAPGQMPHSTATASEGFTVSFEQSEPTTVATRASKELTNVWVLQFDDLGNNVQTINMGTLAAGAYLTPPLLTGTDHTICIVANDPYASFSTSNPATLVDFENIGAIIEESVMSGILRGVTVVDLGGGKGVVRKLGDASATIVLRRIYAEVILTVDCDVTGYDLYRAELYNVPLYAIYGLNNTTTNFPEADPSNFRYRELNWPGMRPIPTAGSGTKRIYKWLIGDNRRGDVAHITSQSDRYIDNAPAFASFVTVTLKSTSSSSQEIYYNICLGSGEVTNFDIVSNHTYNVTATIKGSAEYQESLIGVDARVSGSNILISLTENSADSPFLISLKDKESVLPMSWGTTTTQTNAIDIFDGKGNTDKIKNSGIVSPPFLECDNLGPGWYIPAKAQLMLMWIYNAAIPLAGRPLEDYWASTEYSSDGTRAWSVSLMYGSTKDIQKDFPYYVRCVRDRVDPAPPSWKYPRVEAGNTIVSSDASGGIKAEALLTSKDKRIMNNDQLNVQYDEQSNFNRVSPKFQVASTSASNASTWNGAQNYCKAYSQPDAPSGSWRLPTQRELMLIWMFKLKLTACGDIVTTNGTFWSGAYSSLGFNDGWYVSFDSGHMDFSNPQSLNYYIRCVRDL